MSASKTTRSSSRGSRRDFLKGSATVAGALGLSALSGLPEALAAQSADPPVRGGKLPLKLAGYRLDRVEALIDGRVTVEGCDAQYEVAAIGDMNTDVFSGPQSRDVTEIGLHPFMLAYANEGFRDYSLIPVFPLRMFRHRSIFIRTDLGIESPADLRGKRVATPGFSSTSLTWIRGILRSEYGVNPDDIEWVVSSKDSSAGAAGKVSVQEGFVPRGFSVTQGPAGEDESDLLESGQVAALFHAAEPRAYVEGHPDVGRLFKDYPTVERTYFAKTGVFPIMHAVAIRNRAVEANPWLAEALFNAYVQARNLMYDALRKLGWATISLPWVGNEIEETRDLMGDNYWPYGIERNRTTLEALCRYSWEQGFSSHELTVEELFHPSTLELKDRS